MFFQYSLKMNTLVWHKLYDSVMEAETDLKPRMIKLLRIENLKLALVRTESGFYAFREACPHMGENLHKGIVNTLDEVVCPLHFYRFSLRTGEEQTGKNCPDLKQYLVKYDETGFFVGI